MRTGLFTNAASLVLASITISQQVLTKERKAMDFSVAVAEILARLYSAVSRPPKHVLAQG